MTADTTPALTAESEALINWALDVFYEARPFVSEQLGDMLRAIEAGAVARYAEALVERVARHIAAIYFRGFPSVTPYDEWTDEQREPYMREARRLLAISETQEDYR